MNLKSIDVRFVVVPFFLHNRPLLGVSNLLSILHQNQITSDLVYLNIDYCNLIGAENYTKICNKINAELLFGEAIFASALWGEHPKQWSEYKNKIMKQSRANQVRHKMPEIEELIDLGESLYFRSKGIVENWAQKVLTDNPKVIGFSTTCSQTITALALAKELKRVSLNPELKIIFGGANCENELGRSLARNFPFLSCVVSGEAENVIVPLVQQLLDQGSTESEKIVSPSRFIQGKPVEDLSHLPIPDFTHYFEAIKGMAWEKDAFLAVESSRGCWWGIKRICKFCSQGKSHKTFRSKPPHQFINELNTLLDRYPADEILTSDSILDQGYFKTLFPYTTNLENHFQIYYGTKSNLKKADLKTMVRGGVRGIQPGIESLNTNILKLMSKGVTLFHNLQILKWCKELGIIVFWNFLFGIPGESEEDYKVMEKLLACIEHLPKPKGLGKVRLDRFSSYWNEPSRYGIYNVKPSWPYQFIYSGLDPKELNDLAYYFDYDSQLNTDQYVVGTTKALENWMHSEKLGTLELLNSENESIVLDTRNCSRQKESLLTLRQQAVLDALNSQKSQTNLLHSLNTRDLGRGTITHSELNETLEQFMENKWVIEENGKFLSLVLNMEGFHEACHNEAL